MDNITETLIKYFGHRKFKSELQEQAIRAISRGNYYILDLLTQDTQILLSEHFSLVRNNVRM